MMTFDEFRASGVDCPDIGAAIGDEALSGSAGRLYDGRLYIERWDETAPVPPPDGKPRWLLTLFHDQWDSETLDSLEARLFLFMLDECG